MSKGTDLEALVSWPFRSFRELKRWQMVALVLIVLGTAWASY